MSRRDAESRASLPPPAVSVVILATLALIASLLGIVAAGDNVLSADVTVLEAMQALELPGLEQVVTVSNAVFSTAGALALAVVFIGVALLLHRPAFVLQMAIVIVLRFAGQVLKPIFDSPRPGIEHQPDPSLVSSTLGYPSGHAYTATVVAAMAVLFVHALDLPRWARRLAIVLAVLVTLIALFSRVRIGAHWPSDTVGGVLFGLATVALMQLIVRAIERVRSPASETAA